MKDLGSEEGSVRLELTSSVVSFTLFRFDRHLSHPAGWKDS